MTPSPKFTTGQLLDMRATLDQALEVADEESATSLKEAIGSLNEQLEDKIDALVYVARMAEARAKAISEEAEHLFALVKREQNKAVRVKEFLKYVSTALGTTTLTGKTRKASVCQNGGIQPILWTDLKKPDPESVPERFLRKVPNLAKIEEDCEAGVIPSEYITAVVDPVAVREALEAGEELPFAALGERGTHVRLA